jgi:hypothetical protein
MSSGGQCAKNLIARRNAHSAQDASKNDFNFGHFFRLTVEAAIPAISTFPQPNETVTQHQRFNSGRLPEKMG